MPAHRSVPVPTTSRSAPLKSVFGPLRSVFRSAHAPRTCSDVRELRSQSVDQGWEAEPAHRPALCDAGNAEPIVELMICNKRCSWRPKVSLRVLHLLKQYRYWIYSNLYVPGLRILKLGLNYFNCHSISHVHGSFVACLERLNTGAREPFFNGGQGQKSSFSCIMTR